MTQRPQLYPAMLTPLTARGEAIDEAVIPPMIDFLIAHGADGLFVLGTTGEGINLDRGERAQVVRAAKQAVRGRGRLIVHCGGQTTRDTVALVRDAVEAGADALAVIPPPYYPLEEGELLQHLEAAARACGTTPFYVYVFSGRSGYPVSAAVIARLRERAPNLAGLKVSESPFERLAPYLDLGLPVFIGSEPLVARAAERGPVAGSVSAVASVFPDEMRAFLDDPTPARARRVAAIRDALAPGSLVAAAKIALATRGIPIRPDMRAPLQACTPEQAEAVRRNVAAALSRSHAPLIQG